MSVLAVVTVAVFGLVAQVPDPRPIDTKAFVPRPPLSSSLAARMKARSGCEHWMQQPKDAAEEARWALEWESPSCGENWDICVNGDLAEGGLVVHKRPNSAVILPDELRADGTRMHLVWEDGAWKLDETVCSPHERIAADVAARMRKRALPLVKGDPVEVLRRFWRSPDDIRLTSTLWQARAAARNEDKADPRCEGALLDVWVRSIERTHVDAIVATGRRFVFVRLVPEKSAWKVDSVVCE
jgi:hypothetical protein